MKKLFVLFFVLFLVGCATKIEEVHTVEYRYKEVEIPKAFSGGCIATKPMAINDYRGLSEENRLVYLSRYSSILLGDVKKCSNKLEGLTEYIYEHNKILLTM